VTQLIPRPEYPRPQFRREDWINLNGTWTYVFDFGKSGMQRGFAASTGFADEILVPFCPESELSGVRHTDFIEMMWYQRTIDIPVDWAGKRVLLHFGGVDYECEAFIDGVSMGRHWGGTSSFAFDVTAAVRPGASHNLVLYVRDETRSGVQPGGKQCSDYASRGCHYTRTTGIWQTVWLEAVSPYGLQDVYIVPNLDRSRFVITPRFYGVKRGLMLHVTLLADGKQISQATVPASNGVPVTLPIGAPRPWSPADPFLYDIAFQVLDDDGSVLDRVESYAGLRKVHVEGNRVYLNNEPIYLRLVLDQGFYPDGIWTAPSDTALKRDIELSMQAGFNGARLHQKVFEERFHYWADRLGYLTWGERSARLSHLGRIIELGDRRQGRSQRPELFGRVARDRGPRSKPSLHHRLDALQRDARYGRCQTAQPATSRRLRAHARPRPYTPRQRRERLCARQD